MFSNSLLIFIIVPWLDRALELEFVTGNRAIQTDSGKLGLRLLEDLTTLAAGGSVCANSTSINVLLYEIEISTDSLLLGIVSHCCYLNFKQHLLFTNICK